MDQFRDGLEFLEKNGFIEFSGDKNKFSSIRVKLNGILGEKSSDPFKEFCELYPHTQGSRYLRKRLPEMNTEEAEIYNKMLMSDPFMHRKAIEGLTIDIQKRKYADSIGEFVPMWQHLKAYIKGKTWENFNMSEEDKGKEETYGNNLA